MAREISINLWCDQCATADLRVPGQTATIGLLMLTATSRMDRTWSTVELCDGCRDELLTPLEKLISNVGAPVSDIPTDNPRPGPTSVRRGRLASRPGNFPCLHCDVLFTSPNGMGNHAVQKHHTHGASLGDLFGKQCPICGDLISGGSHRFSVHVQQEHNQPTVAMAFHQAELDGDPLGLVAQARANSLTAKP